MYYSTILWHDAQKELPEEFIGSGRITVRCLVSTKTGFIRPASRQRIISKGKVLSEWTWKPKLNGDVVHWAFFPEIRYTSGPVSVIKIGGDIHD